MVSTKLRHAVKLSDLRSYQIAHKAKVNPTTLSKLMCGINLPNENDQRVVRVGKVLGIPPEECFEDNGDQGKTDSIP